MTATVRWHTRVQRTIQRLGAIGAEVFFPGICCGCGQLFRLPRHIEHANTFEQWMDRCLCQACTGAFQVVRSPLCPQCGQPFASAHGPDHLCGLCQERPFHFSAARAAGLYEGGLRTAIQQLKYQGRDTLARPLGRFLWQTLGRHWNPSQIDRVIPVPLHPRRLRQRGFNQAAVLVREWPRLAKREGYQVPADWIDRCTLQRQRPTQPQTGLKRQERVINLRRAFQVSTPRPSTGMKNLRVLLVDDVMTTGTTADACARMLMAAGAAEVLVLTLARAVINQR
jgi:ComF family protein